MKTSRQPTNKETPSSEQLAGVIARSILSCQQSWANWMNGKAKGLSPKKTKLALFGAGLLAGCYFLALIFYPTSTAEPISTRPQSIKSIPISPSDSLLLMEYIYQSRKK